MFYNHIVPHDQGNTLHCNGLAHFWWWSLLLLKDVQSNDKSCLWNILQLNFRLNYSTMDTYASTHMSSFDIQLSLRWNNLACILSLYGGGQQRVDHSPFWLPNFSCFWFMNDFALPMAHPCSSPTRSQDYSHDIQCPFYSGYLCYHGKNAFMCCTSYLALLMLYLLPSYNRMTMEFNIWVVSMTTLSSYYVTFSLVALHPVSTLLESFGFWQQCCHVLQILHLNYISWMCGWHHCMHVFAWFL
jgi:hypothetical protein